MKKTIALISAAIMTISAAALPVSAAEWVKTDSGYVYQLDNGKNAPKGKNMGHAGAIVSADGTGSAESKEAALADAGVYLAESTIDIVNKLRQVEKDLGIKLTQD